MKRIRYTMPARSQGKLHMQRAMAELVEKDVHRWVFVHGMDSETEYLVRKWLSQRLDGFYCDLQVMYMPHFIGPALARAHIVLQFPPPPMSVGVRDEIASVSVRDLSPRDAVKAIVEATGLSPHMAVCGWPSCLNDVDDIEGGAVEDYMWFEAFSEEGCATGVACTPAPRLRSKRKTIDERSEG